jgi:hypothetical protein
VNRVQEGLLCHPNYWVKCTAGLNGHWSPDWAHIFITIGGAVVLLYLIVRIFNAK